MNCSRQQLLQDVHRCANGLLVINDGEESSSQTHTVRIENAFANESGDRRIQRITAVAKHISAQKSRQTERERDEHSTESVQT